MRYLPHTQEEIRTMLDRIGVASVETLFEVIPRAGRLGRPLALEPALDEPRLMAHLAQLAARNHATTAVSFLGAGIYDHHIPPAVDQLLLRSELYTAYTPYQAELSQGTLQLTFEFQTLACQLLGMDVANASMYDGASALAEAALMARRVTGRSHLVASAGLHPDYLAVLRTYLSGLDDGEPDLSIAPLASDGTTDLDALAELTRGDTAAVLVGYPNFLGCVEPLPRLRTAASQRDALLLTATPEPYALSALKPPGAFGADIAVAEGQALACPPQLGGPGVGLFTCRSKLVRQMPGRLVGETVDAEGRRGFVLTLATREQHIRRERATSNICTNHGLIALALAIRTSMLGRRGFERAGRLCLANAEHLKASLRRAGKVTLPYAAPTFNELVVRLPKATAKDKLAALARDGVLGGVDLGRYDAAWASDVLLAVTEKHTRAQLDHLAEALSA
ncbi:MAG: aminomethyl-transferring glycine dehydrogenase subunit GcvPA [Myxococcales bacterium]|nr:aminomethyl-transferring glycine dehydrogenase subunit GcvPA [Myxococcales bacterium]